MAYKRGTRIVYRNASGTEVAGKVLRRSPLEGWIVCRLSDAFGSFNATCALDQVRAA